MSAAVLAIGMMTSMPASAQGFSGLFTSTWTGQMGSFADFMSAIAYLGGIGFGIKGAMKLKEWNDSKGRDSTLTQALIPFAIAGLLLGLPSFLKVAKDTTGGNAMGGTGIGGSQAIRNIQ